MSNDCLNTPVCTCTKCGSERLAAARRAGEPSAYQPYKRPLPTGTTPNRAARRKAKRK